MLAAALVQILTCPPADLANNIEAVVRRRQPSVVGPQLRAVYDLAAG